MTMNAMVANIILRMVGACIFADVHITGVESMLSIIGLILGIVYLQVFVFPAIRKQDIDEYNKKGGVSDCQGQI